MQGSAVISHQPSAISHQSRDPRPLCDLKRPWRGTASADGVVTLCATSTWLHEINLIAEPRSEEIRLVRSLTVLFSGKFFLAIAAGECGRQNTENHANDVCGVCLSGVILYLSYMHTIICIL